MVAKSESVNSNYRRAGKFGGELNLAVWRSVFATAKLKSANISYLHMYVWRSLTEQPNLNPPIFLQWQFGAHPPNLIPANISGYMVFTLVLFQITPGQTIRRKNKFEKQQ